MSELVEPQSPNIESEIAEFIEQGITQKITRSTVEGYDSIVGIFRCDFEPDQNRYILNVPIHPAMAGPPEVETMVFEENIRSRITNCEKFGLRLELVSNEPSPVAKSVFVETIISSESSR